MDHLCLRIASAMTRNLEVGSGLNVVHGRWLKGVEFMSQVGFDTLYFGSLWVTLAFPLFWQSCALPYCW